MEQPKIKKIKSKKNFFLKLFTHWFSFELIEDYKFSFFHNDKEHFFTIPKGFIYDGATIPWYTWGYFKILPIGTHNPATIIHDFIYFHEGKLVDDNGEKIVVTRKFCDTLYKNQLIDLGYPIPNSYKIYRGTRIFGVIFWREFQWIL
jgi:hypothetical protein